MFDSLVYSYESVSTTLTWVTFLKSRLSQLGLVALIKTPEMKTVSNVYCGVQTVGLKRFLGLLKYREKDP